MLFGFQSQPVEFYGAARVYVYIMSMLLFIWRTSCAVPVHFPVRQDGISVGWRVDAVANNRGWLVRRHEYTALGAGSWCRFFVQRGVCFCGIISLNCWLPFILRSMIWEPNLYMLKREPRSISKLIIRRPFSRSHTGPGCSSVRLTLHG